MSGGVRSIESCRLCGGKTLAPLVDFGNVPLGNNLLEDRDAALAAEVYPLEVNRCGDCGHFQLGHAVAPDLLYATNYTYLSGIGASFVSHLVGYADWAEGAAQLSPGALVVDIGSNDGTALGVFQERGYQVCGVDPAELAARLANERGIETINAFFDATVAAEIVERYGQAEFVTSHNVLAHVDDLAAVFAATYHVLKDGGYFGFEIGYFHEVLRTGCFDTIYHEHLDYHHADPLVRHLTALGFDVVELAVNDVQGGSLRLLLRKTGQGAVSEQAAAFLDVERNSILNDTAFLANWRGQIEERMERFRAGVRDYVDRGAKVIAYGAPTKATLLTKMAGLNDDDVAFVAEDNVHKTGRYLPRTGIPIQPTADLIAAAPDVIVVFAWNFADDIIAKLTGKFDKSVDLIIPLPALRKVTL